MASEPAPPSPAALQTTQPSPNQAMGKSFSAQQPTLAPWPPAVPISERGPRLPRADTLRPRNPTDPRQAHAQDDAGEERGRLRGGGEACPGRFCFIIPCPIPCNCCIIPCPC